jgi:uncharacterized protein YjbJ (UPF0337 family)
MNKDQVKGKVDEVAGRAKRQAGEWTGDGETQGEGAAQEIKGNVQNAWGNAKEAVNDKVDEAKAQHEEKKEIEREQRREDVA